MLRAGQYDGWSFELRRKRELQQLSKNNLDKDSVEIYNCEDTRFFVLCIFFNKNTDNVYS